MNAAPAPERAGNGWHFRLIAVVANAHDHFAAEIDALDLLQEAMDEMLTRLLAIADDIDPRVFLLLQRQQGCVALCFEERLTLEAPRCPQHARLREPGRFWQAACDRRLEHRTPSADRAAVIQSLRTSPPSSVGLTRGSPRWLGHPGEGRAQPGRNSQ